LTIDSQNVSRYDGREFIMFTADEGAYEVLGQAAVNVLGEVYDERRRQDEKWGEQNHGFFGPPGFDPRNAVLTWFSNKLVDNQEDAKAIVEGCAKDGTLGFCDILMEEVVEALDETHIAKVREELVQVAAVAVAAIESIDRNGR
jgi:hypothetical protein